MELGSKRIMQLMQAVSSTVLKLTWNLDDSFLIPIEEMFSTMGQGVVVMWRMEQDKVKVVVHDQLWKQ